MATGLSGELGLVCMTDSAECRFRTVTLSQYRSLTPAKRRDKLREIYWQNIQRVHGALSFCLRNQIRLYRMPSGLFPMSDRKDGESVLRGFSAMLSSIGRRAERIGLRMLIHPDPFVVLNSESKRTVRNSRQILEKHALALDLMGLPRSPWCAMIIHGGKGGRGEQLVDAIASLPENVKSRLCLENDEYSYSASDILSICQRAGVTMIFDNLHHAVRDELDSYDHDSVRHFVTAAAKTWPDPAWQIVHLSNGHASFADRNHSRLIVDLPDAYRNVPWIEVEARGKDLAIADLRSRYSNNLSSDSAIDESSDIF